MKTAPSTRSGCSAARSERRAARRARARRATARSVPVASRTASASAANSRSAYASGSCGRSERPLPRPSNVSTRQCRARYGICIFQWREWTIDHVGSEQDRRLARRRRPRRRRGRRRARRSPSRPGSGRASARARSRRSPSSLASPRAIRRSSRGARACPVSMPGQALDHDPHVERDHERDERLERHLDPVALAAARRTPR